jgi:hypothetical protein
LARERADGRPAAAGNQRRRVHRYCSIATLTASLLGAGCSGESATSDDPDPRGSGGSATGGRTSSGGDSSTGGSAEGGETNRGGSKSAGGTKGSGGSANGARGGATPTGGGNDPGGASGTGGRASGGGGSGGRQSSGGQGGNTGDYGFSYRDPGSHEFSCNGTAVDLPDADWLCTFHLEDRVAYVYAQATAIGVTCLIGSFGNYEVELAQVSIDGVVSTLANAKYDWGGGHHNDSLSFDYEGKTYKYYHSSIGFGFRSCQPMDCLNVYEPGATAPEIEGCSKARTLPEICVPIQAGGMHDPLVDTFQRCPGDTG